MLLGGEIRLTSMHGEGSVFTLYLPLHYAGPDAANVARKADGVSPASARSVIALAPVREEHIVDDRDNIAPGEPVFLVIEDDPHYARILLGLARDRGFKGLVATKGAYGLALARQYFPAAISLDIFLPDMLARPLIDALRHELVVAAPEGKLLLHADRPRLTQALTNLLNNAAKYMDAGGRIALVVQERGHELRVTVADRGIGIAEDRLPHVFEMFSQVESALARSCGGLGIGLSLTQRLVELHGGSVVARSPGLGKGSEFEVILPRALAETAAEAAGARPHAADGATHRPLRILVADDKQDAAATLSMLLEALGHTVACVYDGLAAVQAAREMQPDVALLDIGMPELNGYETCRQIRALPGGAAVYLVAITGWGQPEDRRLSDEAGFDRHLVKPVDADAIEDVLTHVGRKLGNPTAIYANK